MKVMKLEIFGHVHNNPDRPMSSYYSWPLGTTLEEVGQLIDGFAKAFTASYADVFIVPPTSVDFIRINTDNSNLLL